MLRDVIPYYTLEKDLPSLPYIDFKYSLTTVILS